MNILFLGQKPLGQRAFSMLLEAQEEGFRLAGAVSNISTENWWRDNAIYRLCEERGYPFISNEKRNHDAILECIATHQVDCLLSVQHGWILPEPVIEAVGGRAFNLHLSPLPDYKGWHGPSHAILDEREMFGVSLHWLTREVDAGEMAYYADVPIRPDDTAHSLYGRCEEAGLALFTELVKTLKNGKTPPRFRREGEARFYGPQDLEKHKAVTLPTDPEQVARVARACYFPPFEPAYILHEGRKIYLTLESPRIANS